MPMSPCRKASAQDAFIIRANPATCPGAVGKKVALGLIAALLVALALVLGRAEPALARAPASFADLVEQVSDSVVNITTSTLVAAPADRRPVVPPGSPFEDFFRDFFERGPGGEPRARRGQALGSGFVISADGFIVTNNHVIEGADDIEVEFFSGNRLKARVIGTDPKTDIALLKVESDRSLPFVAFGNSDTIRVGDWVMAMGNPLGQGFSVSAGIVSARGRTLTGSYDDYLQTDAAINRGNSGGPLFNMDGEVVGVNTAILSPNGGSIGIGFAMASNVVTKVVAQLQNFGETRRGWLGVRIQDITPDVAEALGLTDARGVLVTDVPEGPARDADMRAGDVIISFDDATVANTRELVRRVGDADVGKAVRVVVLREGSRRTLEVTLGRRETAEGGAVGAEPVQPAAPVERSMLGLTLRGMTAAERAERALPAGVEGVLVIAVDESSEAYAKGMRADDVITEAAQGKVASADDLAARITEARDAGRRSILLLIRRAGDPRFVALAID
jgi:serine protease Do